jgi:hypothetical protein
MRKKGKGMNYENVQYYTDKNYQSDKDRLFSKGTMMK